MFGNLFRNQEGDAVMKLLPAVYESYRRCREELKMQPDTQPGIDAVLIYALGSYASSLDPKEIDESFGEAGKLVKIVKMAYAARELQREEEEGSPGKPAPKQAPKPLSAFERFSMQVSLVSTLGAAMQTYVEQHPESTSLHGPSLIAGFCEHYFSSMDMEKAQRALHKHTAAYEILRAVKGAYHAGELTDSFEAQRKAAEATDDPPAATTINLEQIVEPKQEDAVPATIHQPAQYPTGEHAAAQAAPQQAYMDNKDESDQFDLKKLARRRSLGLEEDFDLVAMVQRRRR